MKSKQKKIMIAAAFLTVLFFSFILHSQNTVKRIDPLGLFKTLTTDKAFYSQRTGDAIQLDASEQECIAGIVKASDAEQYYMLKKDGYKKSYDIYGKKSQYANDIKSLVKRLDELMAYFHSSGLIAEVAGDSQIPALMFDIDNTLEFTAAKDDDKSGEGPPIGGMVEFAKRWCFKEKVACYFITARSCDRTSTEATVKWLKREFKLSPDQIEKYTYLSGGFRTMGKGGGAACDPPPHTSIAYKDIIREALEQKEHVFWLMSIGDQLTDSLGKHSGMKIEVPNQFFHSDIVPNQFSEYGRNNCNRTTTLAPDKKCAKEFIDSAIEKSTVTYCGQ